MFARFDLLSPMKFCLSALVLVFSLLAFDSYGRVICEAEVPEPYMGNLQLDSRYDPSDPTSSLLDDDLSESSAMIQSRIYTFTELVIQRVDLILDIPVFDRPMQRDCLASILNIWVSPGALLSEDSSPTGRAVRKWTVAAISMALFKLERFDEYSLSDEQQNWIALLAYQVMLDYEYARAAEISRLNNHEYWAAWSMAAAGMLLNDDLLTDWGYQIFDRAMSQVSIVESGEYGLLPNELLRGKKSLNYTHFALSPLVMLSAFSDYNMRFIGSEQRYNLNKAVDFAVAATLEDDTATEYFDTEQELVADYKISWLFPFLSNQPHQASARRMYAEVKDSIGNYSLLGGDLTKIFNLSFLNSPPNAPDGISVRAHR